MFKVEHNYAYGWDDAGWTEDDKPVRFPTEKAAQDAIDELVKDTVEAVASGNMAEAYSKSDYRVVPA